LTSEYSEGEEGASPVSASGNKRRFVWILATVCICAALTLGAFVAGSRIHSPNEAAIANAQHIPVVSAEVEERTVALPQPAVSGKVALGTSWSVTMTASEGKLPVVTGVATFAGGTLASGLVLASVSGRPVFALELPFDLYRDIAGGSSGDDVAELQRALMRLGLYSGSIDGEYGARTASSVEALYKRAGLNAPIPDALALTDLATAKSTLAEAQAAAAAAPEDTSAQEAITAAQADVAVKQLAALTPVRMAEIISLPGSSATVVSVAAVNTRVGETPLAELRSGATTASARISVGDKETFAVGTKVSVVATSDEALEASGTVTAVGSYEQADPEGGKDVPGYDITIAVDESGEFSDEQDVQITTGEAEEASGIAVPVTALRQDGDTTYVILTESDEHIEVSVSLTSDGYALVENTRLRVGDKVVVSQS